ncbi:hypothetical protein BDV98DRAFT_586665 [Pterulicium gracile]|uniref:Uncharacterized protein n=1 Tax=Pterulicium gracile TaxID=1884261 RepID=A0A5C3Q6P9_9AGAR|nr:hypothetical protein BDV98DRAFT_586665 [Pterula gracilis]
MCSEFPSSTSTRDKLAVYIQYSGSKLTRIMSPMLSLCLKMLRQYLITLHLPLLKRTHVAFPAPGNVQGFWVAKSDTMNKYSQLEYVEPEAMYLPLGNYTYPAKPTYCIESVLSSKVVKQAVVKFVQEKRVKRAKAECVHAEAEAQICGLEVSAEKKQADAAEASACKTNSFVATIKARRKEVEAKQVNAEARQIEGDAQTQVAKSRCINAEQTLGNMRRGCVVMDSDNWKGGALSRPGARALQI